MKHPSLILASGSPRRADLLREIGFEFTVVVPEVEETQTDSLSPYEACRLNAFRKARVVSARFPDSLVLAADTLVCMGSHKLGKPRDRTEAQGMLKMLQNRSHFVVSGVCLRHTAAERQQTFTVVTTVTFNPLTTEQIEAYHQKVTPFDKAGAYAIQEEGDTLVKSISGSYTNVVGLPIERVQGELSGFGHLVS